MKFTPTPLLRMALAWALAPALVMSSFSCQTFPGAPHAATPSMEAAAGPGSDTAYTTPWDRFVSAFLEEYFNRHPEVAVWAGRHDFDGRLPDWSREALARQAEWLRSQKAAALGFDPNELSPEQQVEREHLAAVLDGELFWLSSAEAPFHNPQWYSGALDPNVYLTREYAALDQRARAYLGFLREVPRACLQIQDNLKAPLAKPLADQGKLIFRGLADYVGSDGKSKGGGARAVFAGVQSPRLKIELDAASVIAQGALRALADSLAGPRGKAAAGADFALGPKRFQEMLYATERVDLPVDEIKKIGETDLKANQDALKEACARFAPKLSLAQCVAREEQTKPKLGVVDEATHQLAELKSFIQTRGFVSIPGPEEAIVRESPPYMRWNLAYIDIPGPYEKGLPSCYYISPPDPHWPAKERLAYIPGEGSLLDTSSHEVWPGHFLQFLHANRARSRIGRVFVGYAYAEGWAHYAEELMYDEGLRDHAPAYRIGQLLGALLRDVRLLSAIGLHTGGLTQADSEKMFREQAFSDPGSARQQAARGTFDPAYLNYTMGKLMIRKLRDDWVAVHYGAAWPGNRDHEHELREFHDLFLGFGGPPIPLVRKALLGQVDPSSLF